MPRGDRVATDGGVSNSGVLDLTPDDTQVDRRTWRTVTITATHQWDDGTLDAWNVTTLQPKRWLKANRLRPGAGLDLDAVLDLAEMGVPEGVVGAIGPAPRIAEGRGCDFWLCRGQRPTSRQ